jgi:23S rRNA (cytidine1920-2'-O)/16S rRNA (cytidine1409-2'-O)-methyltransferase
VLEKAIEFVKPSGLALLLVKPQFEAGRGEVGKGGVIRDSSVHARVCDEVGQWIGGRGWRVLGTTESPITGPEGNVEFLLAARKEPQGE